MVQVLMWPTIQNAVNGMTYTFSDWRIVAWRSIIDLSL